jgi:hypothetical protein
VTSIISKIRTSSVYAGYPPILLLFCLFLFDVVFRILFLISRAHRYSVKKQGSVPPIANAVHFSFSQFISM